MANNDGARYTFGFKYRIFELHEGDKFMGREYTPGWYTHIIWNEHRSELYGPIPTESMAVLVMDEQKKILFSGTQNMLGRLQARFGPEREIVDGDE